MLLDRCSVCGSRRAQIAQKILCEYAARFQARNKNLYVFNSVLHLDEASPHLHIDFIPFYSEGRQRGLSKGVSMRAALKEMGIAAKNSGVNQLVIWEERERKELERLLRRREYQREDKQTHRPHLTVEEYKTWQDRERAMRLLQSRLNGYSHDRDLESLSIQLAALSERNAALEQKMYSPYKSFFYPSPDKQAFVQAALDCERIPYRETDNGFEAQECYAEQIRAIEKQYTAPPKSLRTKLRDDIDRLLMMSWNFDEFLKRLEAEHYEIKRGKYLAVKPEDGKIFIRLKSLGLMYNETALQKRIGMKIQYENDLAHKIEAAKQTPGDSCLVLTVMQNYIIYFSEGYFPVRKKNPKGILTWENDAVLDRLLTLNEKINQGVTLTSLRRDAVQKHQEIAEYQESLRECDHYMRHLEELIECAHIVFHDRHSDRFSLEQAREMLKEFPHLHAGNWRELEQRIENAKAYRQRTVSNMEQAETELREAVGWVETAEQVLGGSFLQTMAQKEMQRRNADSGEVPNGQTDVNAPPEHVPFVPRRR